MIGWQPRACRARRSQPGGYGTDGAVNVAFSLSRASGDRLRRRVRSLLAMRAKPGLSHPLQTDEAVRRSVCDDECDKAGRRSVRPVRWLHFVAPLRPHASSFTLRPHTSSIQSSGANDKLRV